MVPWDQLRSTWPFLYDPVSDRLFHNTSDGYTQHEKITLDYDKDPNQDIIHPVISPYAVPVDVVERPYTWSVRRGWMQSGAPIAPVEEVAAESYLDLMPTMQPWEWQLLWDIDMDCLEEDLWTALTTQVCYIATDGSAPNGKGSFAWVISDSNGTILVKSKGPVYGANITSFRAEGYGILAILRFLLRMKQVHQAHPIQAAGPTNPPGGQITSEVLDLLRARIDRNRAENGEPEYQAAAHAGYPSPMMTLAQQPLVCDNKSMVNKVNVISKYTTIFPNSTMASELVG